MTFFEQELRKIVEPEYPDAVFVGRACYVRLGEMNRAKIQFVTCGTAGNFEALEMTILNRSDGKVDTLHLRFADVWGKSQVNQQSGPYAWTYNGKTEWYAYHPNDRDYRKLSDSMSAYLDVFMEQTAAAEPEMRWMQTMQ